MYLCFNQVYPVLYQFLVIAYILLPILSSLDDYMCEKNRGIEIYSFVLDLNEGVKYSILRQIIIPSVAENRQNQLKLSSFI